MRHRRASATPVRLTANASLAFSAARSWPGQLFEDGGLPGDARFGLPELAFGLGQTIFGKTIFGPAHGRFSRIVRLESVAGWDRPQRAPGGVADFKPLPVRVFEQVPADANMEIAARHGCRVHHAGWARLSAIQRRATPSPFGIGPALGTGIGPALLAGGPAIQPPSVGLGPFPRLRPQEDGGLPGETAGAAHRIRAHDVVVIHHHEHGPALRRPRA